jgi:hypothetical protein
MSDLEAEIIMILGDHEKGLKLESIQAEMQRRRVNLKPVPQWVISFALDSLRVKGLATKDGSIWSLTDWARAS